LLTCRDGPGWSGEETVSIRRWVNRLRLRGDDGMTTAEYAVGTVAAVAFAGLLLKVVSGGEVQGWLSAVIGRALGA
jgi:hypothetical protein